MKAVLLLDKMPSMCGMCRFSTRGTHPFCIATDRTHLVDISKGDRPSWCPLKPAARCKECKWAWEDRGELYYLLGSKGGSFMAEGLWCHCPTLKDRPLFVEPARKACKKGFEWREERETD